MGWSSSISVVLFLTLLIHGVRSAENGCNLFEGSWVYDDSYPLYHSSMCPFIEPAFDCQKNGRPDKFYLNYRWQPTGCNITRFNGEDFLTRLRGKSLMFVGDSLSLNQWQSLTCMLHVALPSAPYSLVRNGGLSIFTFRSYGVKLMFSRNAFLVDIVGEKNGRVLKLDSIGGGETWKGVDVLIFDSWHWWLHTGRKQPWDFIQDGNQTVRDMDRLVAYEKAMKTWAKWVDENVNPAKTRVFFQGVSPDHENAENWGENAGKTCLRESRPVLGSKYPGGAVPAELSLEKVIRSMKKTETVELLDLTTLSQLRKDGHPSIYGNGGHRGLDCSHWCLPGVPDTWNLLLYSALMQKSLPILHSN